MNILTKNPSQIMMFGNGFEPSGGEVEFSGNAAQTINLANGNSFYDLIINNSHATDKVTVQGGLIVRNHLKVFDGFFVS